MDWNGNFRVPFVSRPENAYSFLYNYNYDQFPVLEMKQPSSMVPTFTDRNNISTINNNHNGSDPKKKRLSNEQLELLENSFQDEIKLDPDRKLKLSKELGLQPRQIAVWFQNRRARWKAKQLERLYDALKQEYDAVSRDKHKLQQEVMALRAILKDQVGKLKPISTEISGEETVESTSIPISTEINPNPPLITTNNNNNNLNQINSECNNNINYPLNMDDYNNTIMMPPPYWPSCP